MDSKELEELAAGYLAAWRLCEKANDKKAARIAALEAERDRWRSLARKVVFAVPNRSELEERIRELEADLARLAADGPTLAEHRAATNAVWQKQHPYHDDLHEIPWPPADDEGD